MAHLEHDDAPASVVGSREPARRSDDAGADTHAVVSHDAFAQVNAEVERAAGDERPALRSTTVTPESTPATDGNVAVGPEGAPAITTQSKKELDVPLLALLGALAFLARRWVHYSLANYHGLGAGGFDFGLYDQGLWLLSRGKAPFVTIMGRNLFGDHTSYILLPFVPLYRLGFDGRIILIAQAIALAFVGLPIFLLARDKLKSGWAALGLGVAASAHPALSTTTFENFHPDSFAPLPLAFAFLFASRRQWRRMALCLILVAATKEDTVLLILPFGVWLALRHDRKRGAGVIAASLAFTVAALASLRAINGVGSLNGWRIPFGGPSQLVKRALQKPGDVWGHYTGEKRPFYLWQMLAPTAFLLARTPDALLVFLPLLANVTSTFFYQYNINYHYSGPVVGALWAATVFGIAAVKTLKWRRIAIVGTVAVALWTGYLWGVTPGLSRTRAVLADPRGFPGRFALKEARKMIPKDAVVSVHYAYVPTFGHREKVYQFPTPFRAIYWGTFRTEGQRLFDRANEVEYVVFPTTSMTDSEPARDLAAIASEFSIIFEKEGVRVYKRVKPGPRNASEVVPVAPLVTVPSVSVVPTVTASATAPTLPPVAETIGPAPTTDGVVVTPIPAAETGPVTSLVIAGAS